MLASIRNMCISKASIVAVGVLDSIRMEETTTTIMVEMGTSITREMATTIMAIGVTTITTPQGQMDTTMATTMAETTMSLRRGILVKWSALSATRLGITQMIAHRRRTEETSPTHFRKDMLIMSMWGRFMMSLTLSMVRFSSMIFQHLFFYTGASHSFISRVFVDKNKIPTRTIDKPIKISSPGGELVAAFGCRDLTIGIGKYQFPAHLIVLESQGWMSF
jgi:hypothetical protein